MYQFNLILICVSIYVTTFVNINTKPVLKYRDFHQPFSTAYCSQKLLFVKDMCSKENIKVWTYRTFNKVYKFLLIGIHMIFVPFKLHKLRCSNSILSIQLASSECFSPSLVGSLSFPWHPHPGCSFLALLSSHSPSVKAETKPHLIWDPSLTFPALIFLCFLSSLHFWAFAGQFGI